MLVFFPVMGAAQDAIALTLRDVQILDSIAVTEVGEARDWKTLRQTPWDDCLSRHGPDDNRANAIWACRGFACFAP